MIGESAGDQFDQSCSNAPADYLQMCFLYNELFHWQTKGRIQFTKTKVVCKSLYHTQKNTVYRRLSVIYKTLVFKPFCVLC